MVSTLSESNVSLCSKITGGFCGTVTARFLALEDLLNSVLKKPLFLAGVEEKLRGEESAIDRKAGASSYECVGVISGCCCGVSRVCRSSEVTFLNKLDCKFRDLYFNYCSSYYSESSFDLTVFVSRNY